MTINIDPVAFSIGDISVRWYGLMYVVGITIGLLIALPYARSKGLTSQQLQKIVTFTVPAGLIGARLYYVVQQPLSDYIDHPWRVLEAWKGGMAFYGAIFAVVPVISSASMANEGLRLASVGCRRHIRRGRAVLWPDRQSD
jgi:phosphatidylglycerol---prolipoprotein diacylglyceryl transferase